MSDHPLADIFAQLTETCASAEAGREILTMYDHTVQFTLLDGAPFYFEAKGGQVTVAEGEMPPRSLVDGYEIKGNSDELRTWFTGRERFSDLVEDSRMFPVASHTTKRHIDHWLAQIVRIGNRQKSQKEVY